jgi:Zn-dependent metalloprotease
MKNFYVPGRPPPGAKNLKILEPGQLPPDPARKIILPHSLDPSKIISVPGSGSLREVAQALVEHGAFKEVRELIGKPTVTENLERSLPASTRAQAVDLMPTGVKRVVSTYTAPSPPKDAIERVRRVLDHFFLTGKMPGETRVVREEGGPPAKDRVANVAYDNSGSVYAFYKTALGRCSIDDKGMPIQSIVHQDDMDGNGRNRPMSNAYYQNADKVMRYGDGDRKTYASFVGLDIAGHELTHGVTAHTAGLKYQGQSGALNESFSDVLGMAVRQWKQGVTVDQADWRLGADAPALTASRSVGPIRSMSNPNSVNNQPAHLTQFKVMKRDEDHDWGGVHTNSGIPNRAFYGAAMRIGGYVWEKSAKIWYVALRDYLRPNATFADAARATVHVAGDLYGEGSREQAAVIAGWKDVGIRVSANDPAPTLRPENPNPTSDAK